MKKTIAILLSALPFYANADFSANLETNKNYPGITQINITSKENSGTLNDIQINRGNCKLYNYQFQEVKKLDPIQLKFGKKLTVFAMDGCNVIEVTLTTNQDTYQLSWQ